MNAMLATAIEHWNYIAPVVAYPKNDKEYNRIVTQLDELLDIVGSNEAHKLMGLVDILSNLIASYEETHYPAAPSNGVEALRFLMDAHQLKQADLPEIASQGVLSEILNGKRQLNLRQITLLAKRFHVAAATFMEE